MHTPLSETPAAARLRHWLAGALAALALAAAPIVVSAQAYPLKPIRLIVGFTTGGPNDLIARAVAPSIAAALGQPVIVDNRPGADGVIGGEVVAKSAADGYTLFLGSSGALAVSPNLNAKMPYDPVRDFAPIALIARAPMVLMVNPSLPAKNVRELIELLKANPGRYNYASAGIGSPTHLSAEIFRSMTGVNMVHIPLKGGGPALIETVAGRTHIYFGGMATALPFFSDQRLRALGVTGATRSAVAPEIPTIAESGLPGFEADIWYGLLAPAGTPPAIVARLHGAVVNALAEPRLKNYLVSQGTDPAPMTPQAFHAFMRDELARWAKVIKDSGVKVE